MQVLNFILSGRLIWLKCLGCGFLGSHLSKFCIYYNAAINRGVWPVWCLLSYGRRTETVRFILLCCVRAKVLCCSPSGNVKYGLPCSYRYLTNNQALWRPVCSEKTKNSCNSSRAQACMTLELPAHDIFNLLNQAVIFDPLWPAIYMYSKIIFLGLSSWLHYRTT